MLTATIYLNRPKSAKVLTASEVFIRNNGVNIAYAVLGGRYNERQALEEFRKHPERFKSRNGAQLVHFAKAA